MLFFSRSKPEPTIDRRGAFCNAVNDAIRNALSGYTTKDWALCRDVAADLEKFAQQVKTHVVLHRPLV
jgi:hypothetical protein